MTANRRIFLNIIATYARSLYALVLGLFTARWVLEALGQVDFGLYGLVGGLTVFIGFFNMLLSVAVSANTIKCARSHFVPVNLLCKFTELM